jgi:hypothetical protein
MTQKMTSLTPSIYEIICKKVIFFSFCFNILTIFKVLDNPTVGPVHLELFRPSVIRGPWFTLHKTMKITLAHRLNSWHAINPAIPVHQ